MITLFWFWGSFFDVSSNIHSFKGPDSIPVKTSWVPFQFDLDLFNCWNPIPNSNCVWIRSVKKYSFLRFWDLHLKYSTNLANGRWRNISLCLFFFTFHVHLGHAVLFFLLHLPRKKENELKMFFLFDDDCRGIKLSNGAT